MSLVNEAVSKVSQSGQLANLGEPAGVVGRHNADAFSHAFHSSRAPMAAHPYNARRPPP
ncbi:hypothetical protein [Demequina litorisediminis]|uniref:hypothetical protein n=1 Tax=Demequina litorisediminis TaxID=1849022 RepID=UPI0024E116E7|nr:hypothetical protein [Demequina litorisediminis]